MDEFNVLEGKVSPTSNGVLHIAPANYSSTLLNGRFRSAGTLKGIIEDDFKENKDLLNGKWTTLFSYIPLVISEKLREPNAQELEIVEKGLEALCSSSPSFNPSFIIDNEDMRKTLLDSQLVTGDVYIVRVSPGNINSQSYGIITRPNEGTISLAKGRISVDDEVALDLTELHRHIDHKSSIFYKNNNEIIYAGNVHIHRKSVSEPNLTYDGQRSPLINHRLKFLERK